MAVDAPTPVGSSTSRTAVTGAIRQAARVTGVSFNYLLATAKVESDLNPNLTVRTSTATGLFQFIEQTWLATLKQGGPAFGYGDYADAISRTPTGRYVVEDPALRNEIMLLRKDPTANALMGGVVTQKNATELAKRIGRKPTEDELYVAHFFGPYAGARAIRLAGSDPTANAAAIFPAPAAANRSIFYDRQGNARSIAGVCAELMRRYQVARAAPPPPSVRLAGGNIPRPPGAIPGGAPAPVAAVPRPAPPLPAAETAAVRGPPTTAMPTPMPAVAAFANEKPRVISDAAAAVPRPHPSEPTSGFHSLFHDDGRRGAVAPVVTELWGGRAGAPQASPPAAPSVADQRAPAGGALDLFRDPRPSMRGRFDSKT
jgi:Transglycosylase SLT domain